MCFPWGPIDNNSALIQVMAWCQICDKSCNCIVGKIKRYHFSVSDLIFYYGVLRKYFQCPFYLLTQSAVTCNKKCYFLLLCSFWDEWAPLIPPFPWASHQPPAIGRQCITIKWALLEILFKLKLLKGYYSGHYSPVNGFDNLGVILL